VSGFNLAYKADARYRTEHHGPQIAPPSGAGMIARPFDMPQPLRETTVWDADGLVVRAFRVDHTPVYPAVGYRFDYGGRSVLVSGDTNRSAELARMAHGVDLLVHEALSRELLMVLHDAAQSAGQANIVKITEDVLDYHTSPVEAAEIAQASGAGHLLLYHIVPPLPVPGMASVFLDGVDDAYDGGVTLGVDGTRVSLPAGSAAIELGR
jgi:ribonuclease Z